MHILPESAARELFEETRIYSELQFQFVEQTVGLEGLIEWADIVARAKNEQFVYLPWIASPCRDFDQKTDALFGNISGYCLFVADPWNFGLAKGEFHNPDGRTSLCAELNANGYAVLAKENHQVDVHTSMIEQSPLPIISSDIQTIIAAVRRLHEVNNLLPIDAQMPIELD